MNKYILIKWIIEKKPDEQFDRGGLMNVKSNYCKIFLLLRVHEILLFYFKSHWGT